LNESIRKKIRLKDEIYLYLRPIKSYLKKNNLWLRSERKSSSRINLRFNHLLPKIITNTHTPTTGNSKKNVNDLNNNNNNDSNISDTEERIKNFNKLYAKKFPLNIFVGSDLNLIKNQKLKVYKGKYINTFIVNKTQKKDFIHQIDTNPYNKKMNGNFVYFEKEKIQPFAKRISIGKITLYNLLAKNSSSFGLKNMKNDITNSLDTVQTTQVKTDRSEERDKEIFDIEKKYGLKFKKVKKYNKNSLSKF